MEGKNAVFYKFILFWLAAYIGFIHPEKQSSIGQRIQITERKL
jgi:hypothetical protein